MKPIDPPDSATSSSVTDILNRHGAKLSIHGARGSSHKAIAEDLIAELNVEKHRTSAVQNNLNAILNQWQTTSANLKALQNSHEELVQKYQQRLLELKNEPNGNADDTDTEGK